jgi:hypothetical protein
MTGNYREPPDPDVPPYYDDGDPMVASLSHGAGVLYRGGEVTGMCARCDTEIIPSLREAHRATEDCKKGAAAKRIREEFTARSRAMVAQMERQREESRARYGHG